MFSRSTASLALMLAILATAAHRVGCDRGRLRSLRELGSIGQYIETGLDLDGQYKQLNGSYQLMVVSSAMMYPCRSGSLGNYLNVLNLRNKQDYADLHGYAFHWNIRQVDPRLGGPWNKIAVLRDLALHYAESQVEWFLWVDNDAEFVEMDRVVPFHKYGAGEDVAVWSDSDDTVHDLDVWGVNTGVILLRNSNWTREFLTQWAALGYGWSHGPQMSEEQEAMNATIPRYNPSLYDQVGLIWVLHKHQDWIPRVHLEHKHEFGFHYHYSADLPLDRLGDKGYMHPLVVHYAGCQFCSYGLNSNATFVQTCVFHYLKVYEYASNRTVALLQDDVEQFSAERAYKTLQNDNEIMRAHAEEQPAVHHHREH